MLLISARDNENDRLNRNENKQTNKQRQKTRGKRGYSERLRAKWFCCVFKLVFLQLIYLNF